MLSRVLREMQAAQGTLRLDELAAKVNIEPSALKGMIEFWVGKGRLQMGDEVNASPCAATCGSTCPGASQCPFVAKMPTMYSIRVKD
ncbi:MAG: FeoC-like transcriptional regulator [Anaerolineales bacterium]